jgi:hypothetical protein
LQTDWSIPVTMTANDQSSVIARGGQWQASVFDALDDILDSGGLMNIGQPCLERELRCHVPREFSTPKCPFEKQD